MTVAKSAMTIKCTLSVVRFDGHGVRRCNTKHITQCSMSKATPEATGCRHRVTTHSILPQLPPGQQANKQQSTNTPKEMAILMATVVRRYNTAHIAQWRRSRALLEATKHRHQASIAANSIKGTWLCCSF
jgi:hypothetical protein